MVQRDRNYQQQLPKHMTCVIKLQNGLGIVTVSAVRSYICLRS